MTRSLYLNFSAGLSVFLFSAVSAHTQAAETTEQSDGQLLYELAQRAEEGSESRQRTGTIGMASREVLARIRRTDDRISRLERQIAILRGRVDRPAPAVGTTVDDDKDDVSSLIEATEFRRAVLAAVRPELDAIQSQITDLGKELDSLKVLMNHTHDYRAHGHGYTNVISLIDDHGGDPRFDNHHIQSEGCKNNPDRCLVATRGGRSDIHLATEGPNLPY